MRHAYAAHSARRVPFLFPFLLCSSLGYPPRRWRLVPSPSSWIARAKSRRSYRAAMSQTGCQRDWSPRRMPSPRRRHHRLMQRSAPRMLVRCGPRSAWSAVSWHRCGDGLAVQAGFTHLHPFPRPCCRAAEHLFGGLRGDHAVAGWPALVPWKKPYSDLNLMECNAVLDWLYAEHAHRMAAMEAL